MLNPSPRLRKEASRIGCKENHIIMADLILSGYTESEAFDIAYSERAMTSAKLKISEREMELRSEGYRRAYEDRMNARKFSVEAVDLRDKESVARDLNALINQTTDAKLKAELLMKLADLQQMKKDATALDEDPVQFFLTLDCERCPLLVAYNDYIAKRNNGKPYEEWERRLRPDELQSIIEQSDASVRAARAEWERRAHGRP